MNVYVRVSGENIFCTGYTHALSLKNHWNAFSMICGILEYRSYQLNTIETKCLCNTDLVSMMMMIMEKMNHVYSNPRHTP